MIGDIAADVKAGLFTVWLLRQYFSCGKSDSALFPPLPENRTQGNTHVRAYWYFSIVKKGYVVYTVSRLICLLGV